MIYGDWGFRSSPFQTTSLQPTQLGERLLVGREKEVRSLMGRIQSPPKLGTIEGLNGVGKTSVVNVASYKLYQRHVESGAGPLFIPCRRIFQIDTAKNVQEFIDEVLMEIAQTLIERAEPIKVHGYWLETEPMNKWLNSPQLTSFQGGVWVVQGGMQKETNTGSGFERSGFRKLVSAWLETIFPEQDSGGVICTIDNLELLQSSDLARTILEQLRDQLLTLPGIRWVLCGSLGIIYGVVSSPRLEGFLHNPIEIGEIGYEHAKDIFNSRIEAYRNGSSGTYLPLLVSDFERLYQILKGNIRSVLSHADSYCQWVSDRDPPELDSEKTMMFDHWLTEQASAAYDALRQELRPKALEVFDKSCEFGIFSPSDFSDFGFNSIPAFRPHIRDLEAGGVLVSTQDEGDKRRKTIQVTPKGWLVKFHIDRIATGPGH